MGYTFAIGCGCVQLIPTGGPLLLGGSTELPAYYPWVLRVVIGNNIYEVNREFSTKSSFVAFLNGTFATENDLTGTFTLEPDGSIIYSNNEAFASAAVIGMAIKLESDIYFLKIGEPENPLPDHLYTRSYPNRVPGQPFTIVVPEIYGRKIDVHADNEILLENALGYDRAGTSITFASMSADFTLTVIAGGVYVSPAPPVTPGFPYQFSFNLA